MTTALDTELVPAVQGLLDEYGAAATFQKLTGKSYDATTGAVTEAGETNPSVKITPPQPYENRLVDGTMIQAGDMRTFIAAQDLTFTPTNGYTMLFASVTWRIMRVSPIYTGDSIALWEIQLRS